MAKICTYTFSTTVDNYGQVLQYLATQEYFKIRGHESFLFRPKGKKYNFIEKVINHIYWKWQQIFPKRLTENEKEELRIYTQWFSISRNMENEHPRFFEDFRLKYFNLIEEYSNSINNLKFDAYCVGSDQTWASSDPNRFFASLKGEKILFTIAPSIAHYKFSDREINKLRRYVKRFSFITVREDNGLDFCKSIGFSGAIKILDPTLLLNSNQYDSILNLKSDNNKPYILLYLLGNEIEISVKEIFDYAKKENLEIKYVASQGRYDNFEKIYPKVNEWVQLIKGAKYIFTNSFHGMAFSIIYRKQFTIFPAVGFFSGMNNRIISLTALFALEERIYNGNLNDIKRCINWTVTEKKILENNQLLDSLMTSIRL